MPTIRAHRFWDTQCTTSEALLRIQLRITPMTPGNASAAFTPNLPSYLIISLRLSVSFSAISPTTRKQCFNQNTDSHSNCFQNGSNCNALLLKQCVRISSTNEVSLLNTLAIVSLKLVIWFVSLPLRISMLSCLTDRSSFSSEICFLMSSQMLSSYSGLSRISSCLLFSRSMHCSD